MEGSGVLSWAVEEGRGPSNGRVLLSEQQMVMPQPTRGTASGELGGHGAGRKWPANCTGGAGLRIHKAALGKNPK